jgi:hypothetical protein
MLRRGFKMTDTEEQLIELEEIKKRAESILNELDQYGSMDRHDVERIVDRIINGERK